MGLFLRKFLFLKLPSTVEMVKIDGIWEEAKIQPIKVNPADEAFLKQMEMYRKQVMQAFAIPRFLFLHDLNKYPLKDRLRYPKEKK